MRIDKNEFLQALVQVKPGISSRERVDQSSSVVFSDGKLVAYNEQIMVMAPFDIGFEGAVRAEELFGILNKLSAEQIEVLVQDGQFLIKAGRSKSGIRFEEAVKLPVSQVLDEYAKAKQFPMPEALLPAFSRAKFCAATNMNNPKLTGIYHKGGNLIATDNYRIIKITLPGKQAKKIPEFLIPAACVDYLGQYSFSEFGISDSWAFFSGDNGLLFCARLVSLDEPYPDTDRLFQIDGHELVLPVGLVEAIDKTAVFTKTVAHENDRMVAITMKSGRAVIKGEGAFGWYEESIPAKDYDGEQIQFFASPDFLKDILPKVQRAILGDSVMLFQGEDFAHAFGLMVKKEDD